jgi:FkbM family methyltransferase
MNVSQALQQLEAKGQPFTVVQIGAYIGNTPNDPLWEHFQYGSPCGMLTAVEPIQRYHDKLCWNYLANPSINCCRLAIADHDGYTTMYRLEAGCYEMDDWHNQLSSLKAERLTTLWDAHEGAMHADRPDHAFMLENRTEEQVPCRTFKTFCREQGLEHIDLLVMDVEGSEFDILASMDWEVPIRYLSFEHTLMTPEQLAVIETMLRMRGYEMEVQGDDVFCWREA